MTVRRGCADLNPTKYLGDAVLPDFDAETGYLPPGAHHAPWAEVVERFGFNARRRAMFTQLHAVLRALRSAGCMRVFLNGSFVTAKPEPADFDVAYEAHTVRPRDLPRWVEDRELAGGDVIAIDPETHIGAGLLGIFGSDREGVPKGMVRIALSSLGAEQ